MNTRPYINLDFVVHTQAPFNEGQVIYLIKETLSCASSWTFLQNKEIVLSVALVDTEAITVINRKYRDKDAPTDVLSFGDYSDKYKISDATDGTVDLGELVLCWDFIAKSATIQGVEAMYEFAYVFSHGILHLLGYKHSEIMFALQEHVAKTFCSDYLE